MTREINWTKRRRFVGIRVSTILFGMPSMRGWWFATAVAARITCLNWIHRYVLNCLLWYSIRKNGFSAVVVRETLAFCHQRIGFGLFCFWISCCFSFCLAIPMLRIIALTNIQIFYNFSSAALAFVCVRLVGRTNEKCLVPSDPDQLLSFRMENIFITVDVHIGERMNSPRCEAPMWLKQRASAITIE